MAQKSTDNDTPEGKHNNKLASILRASVLLVFGCLLSLLLLEGGLRLWFGLFGDERQRMAYIYDASTIIERNNRFVGRPYVNFALASNYPGHNSRGYRGPELQTPKPAATYRIFALGGSTTYGESLQADEAYPAQLQGRLRLEYDLPHIEVVNAGVPQYATPDTLANFVYRVLDDAPDMIVVYHAVNDVVTRLVDPAHYTALNTQRGIWDADALQVSGSALVRVINLQVFNAPHPADLNNILLDTSAAQRCSDPVYCPALEMTPQEVLDANPPLYFERNLRNLVALAQANDVDVVFSTWAYYPQPVNGGVYMTYEHIQNGVAQHNAIIRRLADEYAIPLIDLARTMPEGATYWLDGLHMTPQGTREQAGQYAAFLVDNGLLP